MWGKNISEISTPDNQELKYLYFETQLSSFSFIFSPKKEQNTL